MASNVVVVDSSFRRTTVKVNPQTQLTDVVKQACEKWKLRPELYTLKYKNKQIDLSGTYRLAGLPSGAQLDLVQSSRSPSVVNIALQLPQTENNARVTEKFPSTTSIWQILRRFEAGVAGSSTNQFNLTQRGIAQTAEGGEGAGRLFYEMPTVQVMNRELGTFEDLQKTLGQLGITSGTTLLRLRFKNSGRPLEDAMKEITQYFKEEQSSELSAALAADAAAAEASKSAPVTEASAQTAAISEEPASEPTEPMSDVLPTTTEQTSLDTTTSVPPDTGANSTDPPASSSAAPVRKTAVFSAPSTTVPQAATMPHNESDYLPTVDHAKLHQSRLGDLTKNRRLPSDAELEATQKTKVDKLSTIEQINVRVRLPDQTQVQAVFGRAETSADLWGWVRLTLRHPEEEFILKHLDAKGKHVPLSRDSTKKLIQDLGWTGSTLIYMTWGDNVSAATKKEPSLNDENLAQAAELKVNLPQPEREPEEKKGFLGGVVAKAKANLSPGEREEKLKRMMGFGKKK